MAGGVLTGTHFMLGDVALAEGAIAAGCRFFGGYPITPSTEVAERMAARLPQIGGTYVQMEDELASIAAILGAAWGGQKAMTATSGPGFSLMMENLGLGIITETPVVICNVQRGGPSTGLPTLVAQSDMMQARWGSHGHYEVIALVPWSVQECFDLTIRAFNLAERYRTPVLMMADAEVGHLTERLVIPSEGELELWDRPKPGSEPAAELVQPMAVAGEGRHVFVESLTHDERGYPGTTAKVQAELVTRLNEKIRRARFEIYDYEERDVEDAEIVVLAYGITARMAAEAVGLARERGLKAGLLRLRTAWPFPEERVRDLTARATAFVVPEINLGQLSREVERCALDRCPVLPVTHPGGDVIEPDAILEAIEQAAGGGLRSRTDLVGAWHA